ncbi:Hypothetical protein A7982_08357 [Minicystis rosea]|nr:Hypothetical protein A7982_08357 [Minicystis rosea]
MKHRSAVAMSVLAAAAALTACAEVPTPEPQRPASAPPVSTSAPVAEAPPAPPARWARVYQRSCTGSITEPLLSTDGKSVASCGTRFDVERGRFLGTAPFGLLALLEGDRAIVDEFGEGGLTLVSPGGNTVRDAGGRPLSIAIAGDEKRVVSLEKSNDGERLVVVRALPSLARESATSLGRGPAEGSVGLLADGRVVVHASHPCIEAACEGDAAKDASCKQMKCSGHGLFVIDRGAVTPLVAGVRAAGFGARGDVAAIVRDDGSAALIALPDGRVLAPLPPVGMDDVDEVAVSAAGDRVAIGSFKKLSVLAKSGAGFVEVLATTDARVQMLRFSADGRMLFTGHNLAAYREGAEPRALPVPAYDMKLPEGFVKAARKDDAWMLPNEGERAVGEGDLAMFVDPKMGAEVVVSAIDADELDPSGDAETWGKRVATRLLSPHVALDTAAALKKVGFVAWGEPGHRSLELHWMSHGCEDVDSYERVSEKGGAVVRVHIQVYGEMTAKKIAPWLDAFFDDPLGKSPARAGHARAPTKPKAAHKPKARKR